MAYSEKLAERVRSILGGEPAITEKKMFGGLAFLRSGLMFCGILGEDLMARVGADAHDEALGKPGARPMDFTGRPMKGYLFVDAKGTATSAALAAWVRACLAHVATLPAKKGKRKR